MDLSRFDAGPLIAFIAAKETKRGLVRDWFEDNGRAGLKRTDDFRADRADQRADTQAGGV